jgi:hypothetical protein
LNLDDAVNGEAGPDGMLVEDCTAPLATGIRGYFIWGQGADQVYLGNTIANSTREHVVRTVDAVRELIAYNNFTNLDRSSVDNQDNNKGTIEVHRGSYAYVAQNYLYDGELRAGPRGGSGDIAGSTTSWTVFEGNHVFNHEIQIYPSTVHLMIRNNVITNDNGAAINIVAVSPGRSVDDIRILNNTGVDNGVGGQFLYVFAGAPAHSITVENNLWLAPNVIAGEHATAGIYVGASNLNEFSTISHNVWQMPNLFVPYAGGGVMYIWPSWSDRRGYITPAVWNKLPGVSGDIFANTKVTANLTPVAGSLAATAGVPVAGVFDNLAGLLRPLKGKWSAGAM